MQTICIIIAVLIFLLAAFSVTPFHVVMLPMGLAFFAASFLPWGGLKA